MLAFKLSQVSLCIGFSSFILFLNFHAIFNSFFYFIVRSDFNATPSMASQRQKILAPPLSQDYFEGSQKASNVPSRMVEDMTTQPLPSQGPGGLESSVATASVQGSLPLRPCLILCPFKPEILPKGRSRFEQIIDPKISSFSRKSIPNSGSLLSPRLNDKLD